ncbi:hypothetical protein H2200_007604 [Cladophialophora chaetospira]|uniref:KOW domain-containing protein domain-containing protein n=1 Tax=Cladophialophora chaetospira TaxID=386627 RepID=A0AA39CG90_9EURO|nr:hypothetical protein H2200_007604 [Cladophialophora chaetospira]
MQRILRINLQSRNSALKAKRKKALDSYLKDWKEYEQRQTLTVQEKSKHIKRERESRREDWKLGPLAPNRDTGKQQGFYGTVTNLFYQGPSFPDKLYKGPKSKGSDFVGGEGLETEHLEWEGIGNEGNIVEDDRVVVVSGRSDLVGQIGKVKSLAKESKEVTIEGLNLADVEIPQNFPEQRAKSHFTSLELPIPLADVRLIHRHTDPATGKDRDVVVKLLRGGAPYKAQDPNSPLPRHTRYIAGEDIEVPWPEVEIPSYQAYKGDTTRYDVEAKTWTPTVYNAPVPTAAWEDLSQVIKYRRDRTEHDEEYVRMKVLEDARAEWYMRRKIQGPEDTLIEEKKRLAAQKTERIKQMGMSEQTREVIEQMMREPKPKRRKAKAVA